MRREGLLQRVLRWLLLVPLALFAGLLTFLAIVYDWFEGGVAVFQGRGSYDSSGLDLSLGDFGARGMRSTGWRHRCW